jgi:hypothetical protein
LTDADIIDFLDDSAPRHLPTTNPENDSTMKRKRFEDEFEKDEDTGKFVFREEQKPKIDLKKQR